MSFFPRGYLGDPVSRTSRMDYLTAAYGGRMAALHPMDRIASLRDDYMPFRGPYTGSSDAFVGYNPNVDSFVSAQRNAAASQPVYATRGYRNFERFDDSERSEKPATRTSPRKRPPPPSPQKRILRSSNKDLKDTSPKQILKRPASKSQTTAQKPQNEQSLTQHLKQIGSDEPVIGLKHVTEIITGYEDSGKTVYSYTCNMCKVSGNAEKIVDHITSSVHRKNYIKEHKLEDVADKDLAKRAGAIETVHGRGEWTVERKSEGLKLFDKSSCFKKVKKNKDVDMVDLSVEPEKPDGMKEGDVVVEELVIDDDDDIDPIANPKYFVLKQIDKMLSEEEFVIEGEDMAMVVDSIIRKMDAALLQFVAMANAEAGVDDIQLDKDDASNTDPAQKMEEASEPVATAESSAPAEVAATTAAVLPTESGASDPTVTVAIVP